MANPFLRRATEFIRDESAFLSVVSPGPLTEFIAGHPRKDALLDMPVRVIGSPGSGKTMMATLVEFQLVETILRDQSSGGNRALAAALAASNFTEGSAPTVAAVRLPMESGYRDFWELPYEPQIKTRLVLSLVQARGMLGLFRNLTASGRRSMDQVHIVTHDDAEARLERIGGPAPEGMRERARAVEQAVYSIGARLLPPEADDIPAAACDPYQPFETIHRIDIDWNGSPVSLRPLFILDDVHTLHPEQFTLLFRELAKRGTKIGRWMMMRMDTLSPGAVFRSASDDALPGLKPGRDFLDIFMQGADMRVVERRRFRRMATDMADRYLDRVSSLRNRGFVQFGALLKTEPPRLSEPRTEGLKKVVDKDQKKLRVTSQRRAKIEEGIATYMKGARFPDTGEDVRLAMARILLSRYAIRIRHQTPDMFEPEDIDPKTELKADAPVAEAARAHLHKLYDRPYHYGFEDLCDASGENAELFLQLAGTLVSDMETKVIQGQDPALTPAQQQRRLTSKAGEIIEGWSFPYSQKVRRLADHMAQECVEMTQKTNAPLGAGANAVGIQEDEMERLLHSGSELAFVLKFAVAYSAITAVRNYGQGNKKWCLLELSGPVCLRHGLTLKRGGFLERRIKDLEDMAEPK